MKLLTSLGLVAFALNKASASTITVSLFDIDNHGRDYAVNANGSCFSLHGGDLQLVNDKFGYMIFPAGYQCVLWENYNCDGAHTNAFHSHTTKRAIGDICTTGDKDISKWPDIASSFKCCPNGSWCAGDKPVCT